MVFGWKRKAAPEARGPAGAPREIAVGEIGAELDRLSAARRERLVADASGLVAGIRAGLESMLEMVGELEREDLTEEEADRHIRAVVDRGKRQVIAIIRKEAGAGVPDVREYGDVIEANREAHRTIKIIGDVLGRQTRVIHIFAKKYATRLKSTLSELNSKKDELARAVRDHESFESSVSEVRERVAALDGMRERAQSSSGRLEAIGAQLQRAREARGAAQEEKARLESSAEFAEHARRKGELDALDGERAALDREIGSSFARISRPLSKYVYVTSLEKEKKAVMRRMIDSPADALREAGADGVSEILVHVRKAVSSGSVSVKDTAKSEEQIDALTAGLGGLASRIASLESRRAEMLERLRSFDSSGLDSARSALERAESDISALESREREVRADAEAAEAGIGPAMRELESRLRAATSVQYTVRQDG
ncbi:MAG: hypothetical protein OXU86_07415 [Thaumarchaeota archaeon]|nr:hypothetical protein [Nitrososphaerota archaeon]MDD9813234.1 hypothetical protein [Nitrososphaerota archaeon]MDD9826577.1 hypothetical protein [Nitrososphaerota archaeon]